MAKHLSGNASPVVKSLVSSGFVTGKGYSHERFFRKPEVIISSEEAAT